MSTIEAVGAYLAANGHGTVGVDLFYGRRQATPDLCRTVYEYEGEPPVEVMGVAGTSIDIPHIQIVVRAGHDDYPIARDEAQAIRDLLAAVTGQTLSGINVMRIRPLGSILDLGFDESDRPLIGCNFAVWVAR